MTQTSYICNNQQCRKVKGESNHWIGVRIVSGGPALILSSMTVVAFEDCGPNDEHYCGPSCATRRFNEFLDRLRAESVALAKSIHEVSDHESELQEAAR